MVLRNNGWRIVTLAAAGIAAASAMPGLPLALAQSTGPVAPQGNLVWGGHVPPPPAPGEAPVYVPSPAYSEERGYETPNQSAFRGPQPTPPQFLEVPAEAPVAAAPMMEPAPDIAARGPGDYGRTYPVQQSDAQGVEPGSSLPALPEVQHASLPPLGAATVIDDSTSGTYSVAPEGDPWNGLGEASPVAAPPSPGAIVPPAAIAAPAAVAPMPAASPAATSAPSPSAAVPSYAALERVEPPTPDEGGWSWNPFRWGRGSLEDKTPSGYRSLPRHEAACRRELQRHGVQFTDISPVSGGGSCGIQNPIRVTYASKGIAMQPAATLSCQTALQTARWLDNDVRPAARWTLWKRPAAVINASSYRCSRIAGTRTISEHALGNALDISGIRFTDGSTVKVEPKGFFSPRERSFQKKVRVAGCKYFGTVLGPGYNKAHDDHFHFDVKSRMRPVCK